MAAVDLLILGGSGLLGTELIAAADAAGLRWAATHHTAERQGAYWHRVDLTDQGAVAKLLAATRPSAIVNAAYAQSGDQLWPLTAELPRRIAAWTAGRARLVQLSTDVVFGGKKRAAYSEDDPLDPVHEYGAAKARAEALVAETDPDAVLVRTSLMWTRLGDGGPQLALVRNPDVRFFVDEFRNPVHAASVAAACLELAARTEISGPLHVAGPKRVDRLTFARALAPLAGVDPDSLRGGTGADQPGRPADVSLDSSRAVALLRTNLAGLP